jgi:hypothetical protein
MWAGVYASEGGAGRSAADTRSAVSPCKSRRASPTARRSMRSRPRWTTSSSTAALRWSRRAGHPSVAAAGARGRLRQQPLRRLRPRDGAAAGGRSAELAIRFGVILRKVWGGSRTWARAGAGRPDVGMADVLATGTFGPGLPESAPSRRACGPGPAPVIAARESAQLERPFRRRLSAETMRSPTTA